MKLVGKIKFMDPILILTLSIILKFEKSISDRVYPTYHVQLNTLNQLLYRNKFILMTDKKINCANGKSL